jgi:hypothetical protein
LAFFAQTADNIKGHILQFSIYRRYGISMLKKLIAAGTATVMTAAVMALPACAWFGRGFGFGFGRGFGFGFGWPFWGGLGWGGLGWGGLGCGGCGLGGLGWGLGGWW